MSLSNNPRIAIVHDWLVTYAGAERVLEKMLLCYPEADLFSIVDFLDKDNRGFIQNKKVTTSFIQKLPFSKKKFRSYLAVMPIAVEQFDLSSYDIIISSSHAIAKGVITGPDQLHICMCYSPMRWAWDMQNIYLQESNLSSGIKSWIAKYILHKLRIWDYRTANGVDEFIAISNYISRRIHKIYRRESFVIYPPVNVEYDSNSINKQDFYLTASRMVPYKNIPLIIKAFSQMPDKKLIVIGDGPEYRKCKQLQSDNITILGYQTSNVLYDYMHRAKAFVFAAEEDFGITPLEAQACGTPVIAYGKGAVKETIIGLDKEKPTGIFFDFQTTESIISTVDLFESESDKFLSENCRENAARFNEERFHLEFMNFVNLAVSKKSDSIL